MTPKTKEEILAALDKRYPPQADRLTRGRKYMGRDVPEEYFVIQDWCLAQGSISIETGVHDLTSILQGVEYIIQAATGKYPDEEVLTEHELSGVMHYLDRPEYFEGGALKMFNELRNLLMIQLLSLPKGQVVINIVNDLPGYEDIFES